MQTSCSFSVRPVCLIMFALFLNLAVAGCRTDDLSASDRARPTGPVTSMQDPSGIDMPAIEVAGRTEVDLVEEMILHRTQYYRLLRGLVTYYTEHGYSEKAAWALSELNDLKRVKPYRYIGDAITPVATLRPTESIAEADQLFAEAEELKMKGGHGVPALYNQETMKLALAKYKQLVEEYPASDKIDDAAFWIGELHKEYFEEKDNTIALMWYQRSIDWNPDLPHPARFQMAVVYDYRLHDREKALHWYQEVLEKETFNKSNVLFAKGRIRELTPSSRERLPSEPEPRPNPKR